MEQLINCALFRFEILDPPTRERHRITGKNRFDCTEVTDYVECGYRGLEYFRNPAGQLFLYKVPIHGNRGDWKGYHGASFNLSGNGMNLTGVTMSERDPERYGYGFPNPSAYLKGGKKPNPLFKFRQDAFFFIFHPSGTAFELLAIKGRGPYLQNLFRQLEVGRWELELAMMRKNFQSFFPY
jgi:hypothetical protein